MKAVGGEPLWKGTWWYHCLQPPLSGTNARDGTSKKRPVQDSTGVLAVYHVEGGLQGRGDGTLNDDPPAPDVIGEPSTKRNKTPRLIPDRALPQGSVVANSTAVERVYSNQLDSPGSATSGVKNP